VTASHKSKLFNSSPLDPCPVCGRDDAGGDCRISDDGALVLCHHGSTFSPPSGLKRGEVVLGRDSQDWAYAREADDGRTSVFTLHKERALRLVEAPKPALSLARLSPEAKPAKGIATAGGSIFYAYSPLQQVQRTASKQFFSHHRLSSTDQWSKGAGEAPWPAYNEQVAIASGGWLLEGEGEKVTDCASAIDLVAFSQPGNKALLKPELVAPRYERLRGAGVEGIVYLADNDPQGKEKAIALQEVAEGIALPFVILAAEALWPHLPQGGSLDDLSAEELAGAAEKIEKAAALFQKQPKALATTPEKPEKKEKPSAAKPPVLFEDCWLALEAHADELAKSNDSAIKQRSSLANKATDLGINRLTQSDLEKLIYAAQKRSRPTTKPLINGGTFTKKRQPFAVEGLIRHGLNMLVSNAGVGKSRMCGSLAAAWLNGLPTWLGRKLTGPPVEERQVLIIGTDQTIEDWAITLEPVGLCTSLDPLGGDDDEEMKLDPRVTLHTLETDTKLDVDGLAIIRQWADNHPNCMIIVDSFTTCLPPGIDEEKTSAAQPLYQLQEAMGTCWCIVAHHMRKAAGKEGSLGVGAGRGSSAIDGAVSRFLTLSPIYKMENGVMTAQESDTRRQLVSTKRGGATEHLIVDSRDWSLQGSAEALKTEERRERAKGGLNDDQQACLDVLVEAPDKCHTTREVAEALGIDWADEKKSTNVRRWLTRLVALGLVDRFTVGGIGTFKAKP
jgi:hypothetical protein